MRRCTGLLVGLSAMLAAPCAVAQTIVPATVQHDYRDKVNADIRCSLSTRLTHPSTREFLVLTALFMETKEPKVSGMQMLMLVTIITAGDVTSDGSDRAVNLRSGKFSSPLLNLELKPFSEGRVFDKMLLVVKDIKQRLSAFTTGKFELTFLREDQPGPRTYAAKEPSREIQNKLAECFAALAK